MRGNLVRKFTGSPKSRCQHIGKRRRPEGEAPALPVAAGLNRFVWDLRLDPPVGVPGAIYQEGSHLEGVFVVPGTYTLKLSVDGKQLKAPLEVKIGPDVTVAPGRSAEAV